MEIRPVPVPADIQALESQLDAAEEDARNLVDGLDEARGTRRPAPGSWSIAECLDHLATANNVYLDAMTEPARRARERGRLRRGPAKPGFAGRMFLRWLEPPVTKLWRGPAPKKIRPRPSPPLADAFGAFLTSQKRVREFLRTNADLDFTHVRFPNPFIRGVGFSLATGLHVIPAHERRHLWQGWNVRNKS